MKENIQRIVNIYIHTSDKTRKNYMKEKRTTNTMIENNTENAQTRRTKTQKHTDKYTRTQAQSQTHTHFLKKKTQNSVQTKK